MRKARFGLASAAILAAVASQGCAGFSGSDATDARIAEAARLADGVSRAAHDTAPPGAPSYDTPLAMLENADMNAFMAESHKAYKDGNSEEGWGFVAIDLLAQDRPEDALAALDAMPAVSSPGQPLSAPYLRPWALAMNGASREALASLGVLAMDLPDNIYRGHRALLLEGLGDLDGALEAYGDRLASFRLPPPDAEPTPESVALTMAFGAERILSLRKAELYEKMGRPADARAIYVMLAELDPGDKYSKARIKDLDTGESKIGKRQTRSLKAGLAMALNDQATMMEERQMLASVLLARGAEAPFNHFTSSLRQCALLLDPSAAAIRSIEADHLYEHGFFSASARLALSGESSPDERAELLLTAADAELELGRDRVAESLIESALKLSEDDFDRLAAAEVLVRSDRPDRAVDLVEKALKSDLDLSLQTYAYMLKSEAQLQSGDVTGAVSAARKAASTDEDNDQTRIFLASMLTSHDATREEGLDIYRRLFMKSPNDPGIMNNYGYSLVRAPATPDELDDGYRLLRKANRITPFEPNLLDSLGWAYYQYGDFKRADAVIEKAVRAYAPFRHWELYDHLGDVKWRLDDQQAAKEAWTAALNARPPKHLRAGIEDKISNGLLSPAPVPRTPPVVSKEAPPESSDI